MQIDYTEEYRSLQELQRGPISQSTKVIPQVRDACRLNAWEYNHFIWKPFWVDRERTEMTLSATSEPSKHNASRSLKYCNWTISLCHRRTNRFPKMTCVLQVVKRGKRILWKVHEEVSTALETHGPIWELKISNFRCRSNLVSRSLQPFWERFLEPGTILARIRKEVRLLLWSGNRLEMRG